MQYRQIDMPADSVERERVASATNCLIVRRHATPLTTDTFVLADGSPLLHLFSGVTTAPADPATHWGCVRVWEPLCHPPPPNF